MVSFLLEVPVGRFGQGAGEGAGQALKVLQMLWWLLVEFVWRCTWGAGQAVVGQGAVVAVLVRGCWSSAPGAVVVAGGACLAVQSGCLSECWSGCAGGQGVPVRVLVRVLVRVGLVWRCSRGAAQSGMRNIQHLLKRAKIVIIIIGYLWSMLV